MVPQHRAALGALIGLVIFAVDAVATLIRAIFNPYIAQRLTGDAMLAMLLFGVLFVAAGTVAGYLSATKVAWLRYTAIGAIAGALVWSYLRATWPLTGRATATVSPQSSALDTAVIGAIGGSLGGLLLFTIDVIRRRTSHFHR